MKRIYFFLLFLAVGSGLAAQNRDDFSPQSLRLAIPAFMPGVTEDPVAVVQKDSLIYSLRGVFYRKGYRLAQGNRNPSLATPVELLQEMIDAYAKKDKNRIINLYNAASEAQVRTLVNGPEGNEYLTYVRSTAINPLELLAAIAYRDGYLMFLKDAEGKTHVNYVVLEGSEYKLSAFKDNKPTSWNLNVYFSTAPRPMAPLQNVVIRKDSLAMNDSVLVHAVIPEGTSHLALFTDQAGEAPRLIITDNSTEDLNLTKNRISFYIPGYLFLQPDIYRFYLAAFNFPVTYVSPNFFAKEAEYYIKVKE